MKTILSFFLPLFVLIVAESVAASSGNLEIVSPTSNSVSTGAFELSVKQSGLFGTGLVDCHLKKLPTSKRSYFSTGGILQGGQTGGLVFPIHPAMFGLRNGNYTFVCSSYDLDTNMLIGNSSVKFKIHTPPPVPIFADHPDNLIRNPKFLEKRGELPAYWKYGYYGRNKTTQDFLFTGFISGRSLRTTVTDHISGDVKWYFQDVTAIPGRTYIYSVKYHTTTPAKLTVRYTMKDGKNQYDELQTLPVTQGPFASVRVYFIAPKDAVALTVWTSISSIGSLTIDDPLLLLSPTE